MYPLEYSKWEKRFIYWEGKLEIIYGDALGYRTVV